MTDSVSCYNLLHAVPVAVASVDVAAVSTAVDSTTAVNSTQCCRIDSDSRWVSHQCSRVYFGPAKLSTFPLMLNLYICMYMNVVMHVVRFMTVQT
jgi:hypothetical protein